MKARSAIRTVGDRERYDVVVDGHAPNGRRPALQLRQAPNGQWRLEERSLLAGLRSPPVVTRRWMARAGVGLHFEPGTGLIARTKTTAGTWLRDADQFLVAIEIIQSWLSRTT